MRTGKVTKKRFLYNVFYTGLASWIAPIEKNYPLLAIQRIVSVLDLFSSDCSLPIKTLCDFV